MYVLTGFEGCVDSRGYFARGHDGGVSATFVLGRRRREGLPRVDLVMRGTTQLGGSGLIGTSFREHGKHWLLEVVHMPQRPHICTCRLPAGIKTEC